MRLFLAVWVVLFSVQATDLVAAVAPDSCTEATSGSAGDACGDACPRCVCCARVAPVVPQAVATMPVDGMVRSDATSPPRRVLNPSVRHIYHVPKRS
jgi:hypothetical protein